jgi:hypothetical protein
MLEFQQF